MYNPQLETFLRVADAGSFNKAAEEAFITVSAVIKQINLLEEKLGLTLFVRTHKGVTLTESGKSLYRDTKYIVQYCQDSVARAKQAGQHETQVIRIGTSPITPAQVLLDLWPQIHEQCPDIKFQLVPFENTQENARAARFDWKLGTCASAFKTYPGGMGLHDPIWAPLCASSFCSGAACAESDSENPVITFG